MKCQFQSVAAPKDALQVGDRARAPQLALSQDADRVGQKFRFIHEVSADEHDPVLFALGDEVPDPPPVEHIQSISGFVKYDNRRIADESQDNLQDASPPIA